MFRSVRFFRLTGSWPESEPALSEPLRRAAFEPCTAFSESSCGWEPPTGDADGALARRVEGADLLRLRTQTRLLPKAAIDDALEARLDAFRQRMQAEPNRRERRRLKEQTRDELLPKALLRSHRTQGLVLASERLLAVDSLADARTEAFLEHLRAALDDFEAVPLAHERPVGDLLMRIFLGDGPPDFVPGRECRMCDPADPRTAIRCTEVDLADPAVRKHVREGMRLTHLGVSFRDALSCTLDDKGGIGKLHLVGADIDEGLPDEDPAARQDAEIALLAGTLRRLTAALRQALGGYKDEAPSLQSAVGVS